MSYGTLRSDFLDRGEYFSRRPWNRQWKKKQNHFNKGIDKGKDGVLKVTIQNNRIRKLKNRRRNPQYQYRKYLKSIEREVDKPVISRSTKCDIATPKNSSSIRKQNGPRIPKMNADRTVTREVQTPHDEFEEEHTMEIDDNDDDVIFVNRSCGETDDLPQESSRSIFTESNSSDAGPSDKKFMTIMQKHSTKYDNDNNNNKSRFRSGRQFQKSHSQSRKSPMRTVYSDFSHGSRQQSYSPNPRVFLHSLPL